MGVGFRALAVFLLLSFGIRASASPATLPPTQMIFVADGPPIQLLLETERLKKRGKVRATLVVHGKEPQARQYEGPATFQASAHSFLSSVAKDGEIWTLAGLDTKGLAALVVRDSPGSRLGSDVTLPQIVDGSVRVFIHANVGKEGVGPAKLIVGDRVVDGIASIRHRSGLIQYRNRAVRTHDLQMTSMQRRCGRVIPRTTASAGPSERSVFDIGLCTENGMWFRARTQALTEWSTKARQSTGIVYFSR